MRFWNKINREYKFNQVSAPLAVYFGNSNNHVAVFGAIISICESKDEPMYVPDAYLLARSGVSQKQLDRIMKDIRKIDGIFEWSFGIGKQRKAQLMDGYEDVIRQMFEDGARNLNLENVLYLDSDFEPQGGDPEKRDKNPDRLGDRSRDNQPVGRETTDGGDSGPVLGATVQEDNDVRGPQWPPTGGHSTYSNIEKQIETGNSIPSFSFKGKGNEVHGKNPELSNKIERSVPAYESLEDGSTVFNDSDYMAIELRQLLAKHYKIGREMIAAAHEADIDEGEFLESFSSWLVHDWKAENGKQFRLYKDGRGLSKLFGIHAASIKSGWVKGKPSSTLETFAEKYVSWMRENCISTFKGDTKYQGYPETVYQEEVRAIQRLLANGVIGPDELRAAMIVGAHDPDVWSDYPFMWSGMDLNDKHDILRVRSNNLSRALRILKAYDDERVNHYQKLKEGIENGH